MAVLQIVIDTNVLVSGLRSRRGASNRLLVQLDDPRWQLNLSNSLLLEYEAVLKREADAVELTLSEVDELLDGLCAIAREHDIDFLWRPISQDPNDDLLIELGIQARADFIVTYNRKDLQVAEQYGVKVVTPREFLRQAGEIK